MQRIYLLLNLFFVFFLSTSCQRNSSWHLSEIASSDIQYRTAKLRHECANNLQGIELEFLCMDQEISAYLNIFSEKIAPLDTDPLKSSVIFYMDGVSYTDHVDRLRGGQRFRLSEKTAAWLTENLQQGKTVEIFLEKHRQTITAEEFAKKYAQFSTAKSTWQTFFNSWNTMLRGPL